MGHVGRLHCAALARRSDQCAVTERLLLQTYGVALPRRARLVETPGTRDAVSTGVLAMLQPDVLNNNVPLTVTGDGNCMFRAVSRGLFGTEEHHLLIRLLTSLELIQHPQFYDTSHPNYKDKVCDVQIYHDPYHSLVISATEIGDSSEFMLFFAVSAALKIALKSYCPPAIDCGFCPQTLTRKVIGRGVRCTSPPVVTLMWTTMSVPQLMTDFKPNHFVVLHPQGSCAKRSASYNLLARPTKKVKSKCSSSSDIN